MMNPQKAELTVEVVDGRLIVAIGIETLAHAIEHGPASEWGTKVIDPDRFAQEVRVELLSEQEDGTTLIHEAFDKAAAAAIEDGAEGVRLDSDEGVAPTTDENESPFSAENMHLVFLGKRKPEDVEAEWKGDDAGSRDPWEDAVRTFEDAVSMHTIRAREWNGEDANWPPVRAAADAQEVARATLLALRRQLDPPAQGELVGWRDISTAPINGTLMLLWTEHEGVRHHHIGFFGTWHSRRTHYERTGFHNGEFELYPTHWMPLPPAPSGIA